MARSILDEPGLKDAECSYQYASTNSMEPEYTKNKERTLCCIHRQCHWSGIQAFLRKDPSIREQDYPGVSNLESRARWLTDHALYNSAGIFKSLTRAASCKVFQISCHLGRWQPSQGLELGPASHLLPQLLLARWCTTALHLLSTRHPNPQKGLHP